MTASVLPIVSRIFLVLLLSCLISLFPGEAGAQPTLNSGDEDLFKEMEDSDEPQPSDLFNDIETEDAVPALAGPMSIWQQLGSHMDSSLRLRYGYFFDMPADSSGTGQSLDNTRHMGESLLKFSTWTGSNTKKLKLSGWFEFGTQADTYRWKETGNWFQDKESYRRVFELNEVYGIWSLDTLDLMVGKKEVTTGISTLFSPSDRFRPSDLNDPMDPKQFGLWQIRSDYYYDNSKIEMIFMPIYTYNKFPAASSRWWGDGTALLLGNDLPDISWEYIDLFLKYKTTISGWDLFISSNSGPNPYMVVKEGMGLFLTVNRIFTLAGGFSTTWDKFEIHGESLYNHSYKGRDDDYLTSVIGFTYTIDEKAQYLSMEEVSLTLEYAGEIILNRQDAEGYTISSKEARLGVNELYSRLTFKYDEDLTIKNHTHLRLSDQSWMNRFETRYRFSGTFSLTCALEIFEGDQDNQNGFFTNFQELSYGQWDKNDRVIVMLTHEF